MENHMKIIFDAISVNESFARMAVVSFMSELDPTLEQIEDVRMAVSEAVTNAIIHGYKKDQNKQVTLECSYRVNLLEIKVTDQGVGIIDVHKAMEPFYTSGTGEDGMQRAGMGFAFMKAFMDDLEVESKPGEGTKVIMRKEIVVGKQ